ncbi:hypothetical protein [Radiobacillus sp. PE A8.2]|uniref:hypothetical protein n=1 Tax=Radiobacillus sp. PE A8.2 TaxID=3380349 RepID=UPI0038907A85
MSDSRLDRIESMITQLVSMVGNIQNQQQDIIRRLDRMTETPDNIEQKRETHHNEINKHMQVLKADQDFIWEKAARNEREIARIKSKL